MQRTRVKDILNRETAGGEVLVQGWVKTRRSSGAVSFIQISDGSTLTDLQIVVEPSSPDFALVESLSTGCSVSAVGELVESEGRNQKYEIKASRLEVLGQADPEEYPLQKKRHTLEFLREIAHLRPRTNTFGAMARVRNTMAYAIHSFFQERGFQYIQTPMITASDAEGAGSMFRVTTLDLQDPPRRDGLVDNAEDFFGQPTYLTVSGQLEAEIFAPGPVRRLHLRPHLSRRKLQYLPPPGRVLDGGARGGLLRPGRPGRTGRGFPEVRFQPGPGTVPRGTWPSSTAGTITRPSRLWRASSTPVLSA